MRTSRWILYTVAGTMMCLLYVFQQTEIVKLGYKITKAEKDLESCLDRKIALEYTLSSLESPLNIDKSLFMKGDDFEMARGYKFVKLTPPQASGPSRLAKRDTGSVFKRLARLSWFSASSAEAKTIK